MPAFGKSLQKKLEHLDPGKLLVLIMTLVDDCIAELYAKINTFLQEMTESPCVFHVVMNSSTMEAHVDTVGSKPLKQRTKIYMPELFVMQKRRPPSLIAFESLNPELTKVVGPHMTEEMRSGKMVVVAWSRVPFSQLVFLVQPANPVKNMSLVQDVVEETNMFVWPTMLKALCCAHERALKYKCQRLLRVARKLIHRSSDVKALTKEATEACQRLFNVESVSLLTIDMMVHQFVEQCYLLEGEEAVLCCKLTEEDLEVSGRYCVRGEGMYPLGVGVTSEVVATGDLVNAEEAGGQLNFDPRIDTRPNIKLRNFLFFPIRDDTGVIGVCQLFNKRDAPYFDRSDEEMALALSMLFGMSLARSALYKRVEESYARSGLTYEVMRYHMKVDDEEVSRVLNCPAKHSSPHISSVQCNIRALPPREYPCYIMLMFDQLELLSKFTIHRIRLAKFILHVKMGYRDVPYHNFHHSFSVTQFAYAAIIGWKLRMREYMTDLECLIYLIAAMVHDMDHRGTSNNFQIAGNTTLAALYSSDGSVLERHHFSQALSVLNTEGCDILTSLPRVQYDEALIMLRDYVLATDLATYFEKAIQYQRIANDGFVKSNRVHHASFMSLMMNAADLCDQVKEWTSHKKSATNVMNEFFTEAQLDKTMGLVPPPTMDPEHAFIPDLEINFTSGVAVPIYELLAKMLCADISDLMETMNTNMERWDASRVVFAQVPTTSGLAVLLSRDLDSLIDKELRRREEAVYAGEGVEEEEEPVAA